MITENEIEIYDETITKKIEYLIERFSKDLNLYHGLNKDLIWWRTILGEWIKEFVHFYESSKYHKSDGDNKSEVNHKVINQLELETLIPFDSTGAAKIFYNSNRYWFNLVENEIFYKHKINFSKKSILEIEEKIILKVKKHIQNKIQITLIGVLNLCNTKRIFSHTLYLNKIGMIKLFLRKQIIDYGVFLPRLYLNYEHSTDYNFREDNSSNNENANSNDEIYYLAKRFIPKSYLENFDQLFNFQKKYFPKNSRKIITANAHLANDVFKIYVAENRQKSTIIVFQHGGDYGMAWNRIGENLEIDFADYFYTWGWESKNPKIKKLGIIKNYGFKTKPRNPGENLLVIEHVYIHNHRQICGFEASGKYEKYKNIAKEFTASLDSVNRDLLKIRSLNYVKSRLIHENNSFQESVFKELIDHSKFSNLRKSLVSEVSQHKLVICMTNSTPFLEILNSRHPIVGLWPRDFEYLRKESRKDFDNLREIGVIFHDERELANFINLNLLRIEEWWQEIVLDWRFKNFIEKYCKDVERKVFYQIFS